MPQSHVLPYYSYWMTQKAGELKAINLSPHIHSRLLLVREVLHSGSGFPITPAMSPHIPAGRGRVRQAASLGPTSRNLAAWDSNPTRPYLLPQQPPQAPQSCHTEAVECKLAPTSPQPGPGLTLTCQSRPGLQQEQKANQIRFRPHVLKTQYNRSQVQLPSQTLYF